MFNIGIIVSELLTNSFKYAFPDGQKGNIYISCQQLENGSRELVFEDDGIGIRNFTTTQTNGSFGMELVKMLVEQLNGKIKLTTDNGTRYQIVF
jgi:two-component sensor histidine kinase